MKGWVPVGPTGSYVFVSNIVITINTSQVLHYGFFPIVFPSS
jgi:hypothetical protein